MQEWLAEVVIRHDNLELVVGVGAVARLARPEAPFRMPRLTVTCAIRDGTIRAWVWRVPSATHRGGSCWRRRVIISTLAEVLGVMRGMTVARRMGNMTAAGGPCSLVAPPDDVLRVLFAAGAPGPFGEDEPPWPDLEAACALAAATRSAWQRGG